LEFHWGFIGVSLGFRWGFIGVSLGFHWGFIGVSLAAINSDFLARQAYNLGVIIPQFGVERDCFVQLSNALKVCWTF
jgi:hypothetical protein